jgi:hypothetical protein
MPVSLQNASRGGIIRRDIRLAVVVTLILAGITALSVYCAYYCFISGTISYWMYVGLQ